MNKVEKNNQISELLQNAKSIAILPSKVGGVDPYCAGVALYHTLKAKDKKVALIYPGKIPDKCEGLVEEKEITSDVTVRELMVTINYADTPAARAQYSTEPGVLYIKLGPVDKSFDLGHVKAELHGSQYDVFITIGAQVLEDFGQTLREMEKEIFAGKIINIDNTDRNFRYGHYNLVDAKVSSLSQMVLTATSEWLIGLPEIAAKAILHGILHKSGH